MMMKTPSCTISSLNWQTSPEPGAHMLARKIPGWQRYKKLDSMMPDFARVTQGFVFMRPGKQLMEQDPSIKNYQQHPCDRLISVPGLIPRYLEF
ncbi:hypothetical protein U0539_00315 (plasmid) [Klebsiella pneumoniae subsp. pneumoniae]|nr:hypothetical protein U0539_00315 [Klebsiella pneumoniae subsp. pneumoniae]